MDVSFLRGRGTSVALAASASLNIALLGFIAWPESEPADVSEPAVVAVEEPAAAEALPVVPEEASAEAAPAERKTAPADGEVTVTLASVEGSIPQTLAVAAAPYGDFVSATLSRLLVWDLDLRRDLRKGDKIEAAWTLGTTDTVVIEAARFYSQKHNKTITGYRFQATGDKYPSYWSADGVEVPHRLRKSPMKDYEQITSLLKDRPTHHGMDFKVAVGTPIETSFDGVVTRVNWNWSANGNCIEIQHNDGVLAKYLHLSENKVKAGDRVKAGDVIALSGNTGRSTGPHLHYQLNQGSKVIDPIDYHGTDRRTLPEADHEAFAALVKAADARFASAGELASN